MRHPTNHALYRRRSSKPLRSLWKGPETWALPVSSLGARMLLLSRPSLIVSFLAHDCDQTSKYEDKREATRRSILPTPDETQANQSAGFSSAELAGCSNVLLHRPLETLHPWPPQGQLFRKS